MEAEFLTDLNEYVILYKLIDEKNKRILTEYALSKLLSNSKRLDFFLHKFQLTEVRIYSDVSYLSKFIVDVSKRQ
jgi:hypothetical protein